MMLRFSMQGKVYAVESGQLRKTPQGRNVLEWYNEVYVKCPIAFFVPHGLPWAKGFRYVGDTGFTYETARYPREWENDGKAFLNDWGNDVMMLVAPSKTGKSYLGAAKMILFGCDCDPEWEIFTHNGIVRSEKCGNGKLIRIFSFRWENVNDLWRRYRELLPRDELGPFAPQWGKYPKENGKPRTLNFGDGKPKELTLEKSGTVLSFNCYSQSDSYSEGYEADAAHYDEQPDKKTRNGFLRGSQTRGDYTPEIFTMTPRVMEGREDDTGAAGFAKLELWDGTNTGGKKVARYHLTVDSTPDAIISAKKKVAAYKKWADPNEKRSEEDYRAGLARYWGLWEIGGGAVIDNYYPLLHLVPDEIVDWKHPAFRDATLYRGMDHGRGRPMACIWCLVFPWGHVLAYREYYQEGKVIGYHSEKIVQMSGNERNELPDWEDPDTKQIFKRYEEVFRRERYAASVMDGRSFRQGSAESARTLGEVYNDSGLFCKPARTDLNKDMVPQMKRYFARDDHKNHLMWYLWKNHVISDRLWEEWLKSQQGKYENGPNIYFLHSLRKTKQEFVLWTINPRNGRPKPENDHIAGAALKYVLAEDPRYLGRIWRDSDYGWDRDVARDAEERRREREEQIARELRGEVTPQQGGKYVRYA